MLGQAVQHQGSAKLQVGCGLLAALGYDVEADLLAVVQAVDPSRLQGRDVHEHVLAAVLRLDEAEALVRVGGVSV
jgi:hypothetical protein